METSEWDYCGFCGRELTQNIVARPGKESGFVVLSCPQKSFLHRNHDEYVVKEVTIHRPTKFDRRTGKRL